MWAYTLKLVSHGDEFDASREAGARWLRFSQLRPWRASFFGYGGNFAVCVDYSRKKNNWAFLLNEVVKLLDLGDVNFDDYQNFSFSERTHPGRWWDCIRRRILYTMRKSYVISLAIHIHILCSICTQNRSNKDGYKMWLHLILPIFLAEQKISALFQEKITFNHFFKSYDGKIKKKSVKKRALIFVGLYQWTLLLFLLFCFLL